MSLAEIPSGRNAIIRGILGGFGLSRRLDALGIRTGKKIVKVSTPLARGPVVLRCGNTQLAIGFGMARKIIVELI